MERACVISLVCFFAALNPIGVKAQLLDYGPYSGYGLAKGILGNDYTQPLPSCITGTEKPLPASRASIKVSIVYNWNEYKQSFHIDHKAEASFLDIGGGGSELHLSRESFSQDSSFHIIVEAASEFDGKTLDNIIWDSAYKSSIESGDLSKIQTVRVICGDRFIQSVFNEARLYAVLHVSANQQSTLTKFSGQANGKIGIDVISASASLGGDASISSANKSGAINMEVFSQGLGGIIPTSSAIGLATSDGLSDIANKLASYLQTLKPTGQPVKYQLAQLPGIPAGTLGDDRLTDRLVEIKNSFLIAKSRLLNVNSLLGPDARRRVLKQPQADNLLKNQRRILSNFADATADAHDICRKAARLSDCTPIANKLDPEPDISPVELPPIRPLSMGPFVFAIDGESVAQSQNVLMFSTTGITLLDAARAIQPNAKAVDVIAMIGSDYVSHADILVMKPNPPYLPITVGGGRLQKFDLPDYFANKGWYGSAIHVLHADDTRPCRISNAGGLSYIEESCLTTTGRLIFAVASANIATTVSNFGSSLPATFNFPLLGAVQDCFTPGSQMTFGFMRVDVSGSTASLNASSSLFLQMPGVSLPILRSNETLDSIGWQNRSMQSSVDIAQAANNAKGASLCVAHIP